MTKLYDNVILTKAVIYDEIYPSIIIYAIYVILGGVCLSVDLVTNPDYLGRHVYNVENKSDFSMEFGVINES